MKLTVIHIGAGNSSRSHDINYKKLLKQSLTSKTTKDTGVIRDILTVSSKLERHELTNTGYGSCLDIRGNVSCDAAIIECTSDSRSELSMHGIIDQPLPITQVYQTNEKLRLLYDDSTSRFAQWGLTRPITLDYGSLAQINQLLQIEQQPVELKSLVSRRMRKVYDCYMQNDSRFHSTVAGEVQDTIGVMVVDTNTHERIITSSSGGNFFKLPGRIGCAGVPQCAIENWNSGNFSITSMCSGNGEQIISCRLAATVVSGLRRCIEDNHDDYIDWSQELEDIVRLVSVHDKPIYAGVLVIIEDYRTPRNNRVVYCHTTETFYFGFKKQWWVDDESLSNSESKQVEIVLSRLGKGSSIVRGEFKA